MSLLNQSGEELVECPLCMEPLEVDDLYFFPCTCGYQICRFCWHRIRTDENGLCPACRKAYPEDPADFKPLSTEAVAKLKAEKRAKDQLKKQKNTESKKHLSNVRVVQRNLVFVVGLPIRLADPEMLKKQEYFGKFGKIHKVVINQSTSYAGSQGPSASAYVTYNKSDDALRAIETVNNISVDGRTVKTSLGTTKYCSNFIKNQPCPKQDCMYLHELGDAEASFTKEEMQQGKHQEYERKLHENLLNPTRNPVLASSSSIARKQADTPSPTSSLNVKEAWPTSSHNPSNLSPTSSSGGSPGSSPPSDSLQNILAKEHKTVFKHKTKGANTHDESILTAFRQVRGDFRRGDEDDDEIKFGIDCTGGSGGGLGLGLGLGGVTGTVGRESELRASKAAAQADFNGGDIGGMFPFVQTDNNSSFFSSNDFTKLICDSDWDNLNGSEPVPEAWPLYPQNATNDSCSIRDDDLGFDPFHETQKALAEMIETEERTRCQSTKSSVKHHNRLNSCSKLLEGLRLGSTVPHSRPPPPGFTSTPNHMNAFGLGIPRTGSKILQYIHPTITFPTHQNPPTWDWPSLDPAIVTSAQHCDLYSSNPPPGFSLRQTLDNL